jgi:hypothetical protein
MKLTHRLSALFPLVLMVIVAILASGCSSCYY